MGCRRTESLALGLVCLALSGCGSDAASSPSGTGAEVIGAEVMVAEVIQAGDDVAGEDTAEVAPEDVSAPSDASPPADAGATDTGPAGADAANEDTGAPACVRTKPRWGLGEGLMLPGTACNTCHSDGESAKDHPFVVAGTVFVGPECLEPVVGAVVSLESSDGSTTALVANEAGNFYVADAPPGSPGPNTLTPGPWSVSVALGDRVATMMAPVFNGDCNSCHQPGAAGYITLTP
jgi:hypothetical protein